MPKIQKEFEIRSSKLENQNEHSLDFDGVDDYVNITANSAFNFTTPGFTIEAWIKPDVVTGSQNIFDKTDSAGSNGYRISLLNTGLRVTFWRVVDIDSSVVSFTAGTWQHIAVVFDSNQDIVIYKNGVLVETVSNSSNPISSLSPQSIGRAQKTGSEGYFDGLIDEVRIWNVARSATEIAENYNKRVSDNSAGLVGYWKFDQGSGTTAFDSSDTGADGTLINGTAWSTDIQPIYTEVFKGIFPVYEFSNFSSTINSGLSSATLVLPRKFDNYGRGEKVDYNNKVELFCFDKENPSGQKIYSGYILGDTARVSADGESVTVDIAGYITKLTRDYVQNNLSQFKFTLVSAEIGSQIETILDYYKAQNPLVPIDYTVDSIDNTAVNGTIDISTNTYLDVINALSKLAGAGWYYYLDADSILNFKQISSTAKHFFTFEKDIADLQIKRSIANTYNEILFASDTTGYSASDTTSQIEYGRLVKAKQDNRYSDPTSINDFNDDFIAVNKDPFVELEVTIIDSNYNSRGYDIESIKVGDTFSFRNYENAPDIDGVHVITNLTYNDQSITIKSQDVTEYLEREIFALENEQQRNNFANGPTTY